MRSSFVIFAGDTPEVGHIRCSERQFFPVTPVDDSTKDAGDWARAIATTVHDCGYDGGGVMLALPSQWCLSATIPIADLPKHNRRQLMIYRLEEQLPVAAEELATDFCIAGDQAMGVCVLLSKLRPWVDALENAGIAIQSIVPVALLVASAMQGGLTDILLLSNGDSIEILPPNNGIITGWTTAPGVEACRIQLRQLSLLRRDPLTAVAWGLDDQSAKQLSIPVDGGIAIAPAKKGDVADDQSIHSLALGAAFPILRGERAAPVDLRRDALAPAQPLRQVRLPLTWALAAAILFGLSVGGSMLLRARAYARQAQQSQAMERSSYEEALGWLPVGANIKARLASEDRRLRALSGTLGDDPSDNPSGLPGRHSALMLLDDTLRSLPSNLRYRLLDLRFSPDGLELGGQTRDHGDADAITAGLRRVGGFAVDPPHSEIHEKDKAVDFTISARLIESSSDQRSTP